MQRSFASGYVDDLELRPVCILLTSTADGYGECMHVYADSAALPCCALTSPTDDTTEPFPSLGESVGVAE